MLKHKPRQIYYKHVHIKIDMFFPRYNNKSKESYYDWIQYPFQNTIIKKQ